LQDSRVVRLRLLLAVTVLPVVLWAFLPVVSNGQTARQASIQKKIQVKRGQIGAKKGVEKQLRSEVQGYTRRITALDARIGTLRIRVGNLQRDLDAKRAELERTQEALRAERRRLARLRARLAEARVVISQRLVELYQADTPDLVSVVLESDGFADLLERGEFVKRVHDQDERIVRTVRAAKADAIATTERLDTLERRQQRLTAIVLSRRNEVDAAKQELIDVRVGAASTRTNKQDAIRKVRGERLELQEDLDTLEKASARIAAQLQAPSGPAAGPIRKGTGRFIVPVNGTFTSPFGPRWGRLHAGVDYGAPEGTPIRAADSGTVVLLQGVGASGGYGNYTCIGHGGGISTCYAHQVRFGTTLGANVSQGQVIGYVGNTGHSFGAHLHFEVRINGNPVDPMGYL
jgi:murein DD-endopeptidase MepM/ murein hydrolase activator NlpD